MAAPADSSDDPAASPSVAVPSRSGHDTLVTAAASGSGALREQGQLPPPEELEEFRLKRLLGRGGMGEVWLAEDRLLGRLVAVKLIAAAAPSEASRERFRMEARAVARLSHPNVVAVYRVGEASGRPFIVSEYVRGESLAELAKPVPWQRALAIGIDLARGLAAAHRRGVLHRDIKPANAVASDEGPAKLLDFGLAELLPEVAAEGVPSERRRFAEGGARIRREPSGGDTNAGETPPFDPEIARTLEGTPHQVARPHIVGTPRYMAPEIWRGEPATPASDVYSLGLVLFQLCAGKHPRTGLALPTPVELASDGSSSSIRASPQAGGPAPEPPPGVEPLLDAAPGLPPDFAAIVDRCLLRDPSRRFADGDALREALERLAAAGSAAVAVPEGGPYRGLLAFEAEHRGLFFGRSAEVRAILDRLRAGPFVIVAGDSGVGKSSLCRAGVLPAVAAGGLGGPCTVATAILGRQPLASLAVELAPLLGMDEVALVERIRVDPAAVARSLRTLPHRVLLFVDQLEELCTLATPAEAEAAAEALRQIVDRGGVRLLATARSDFLARLSSLPSLGDVLAPALFFLQPLSGQRLRDAIIEPASAKGFSFESDAMVAALSSGATGTGGGLPLLQFALAELWEARDEARRVIPARALQEVGGVTGALARHADSVLAALPLGARGAAREVLLRLVTEEGARARRTEAELAAVAAGPEEARAAIAALVRGRLLVAGRAPEGEGTAYTIAHEALLAGWGTLQGWLRRGEETRALLARLERASLEWERLGRSGDALWGDKLLREAVALDAAAVSSREAAFLAASRRAVRNRRLRRWAAALAAPLAIGLAIGGMQLQATRALSQRVAEARRALAQARVGRDRLDGLRAAAFARFDAGDPERAEGIWSRVLAEEASTEEAYAAVDRDLELVLRENPGRSDARALLGDALLERAALADRGGRTEARDDLVRRIEVEGDAAHRALASVPAHLLVRTSPPTAEVSVARVASRDGRDVEQAEAIGADGGIAPGSIVLSFAAPGCAPVRLPLLLGPGESAEVTLRLPPAASVAEGFVFVPEGRFLWGTAGGEEARAFFGGPPVHVAETGAFLIARDETTYADWIAFLRSLPREERPSRMPAARGQGFVVALAEQADGAYELTIGPEALPYVAQAGAPIRYPGRHLRSAQDWSRFPVSGVSFDDVLAYAGWLDRTGRVPGARPCNEREWERAARGADGREFPGGARLDPDDANHDLTYGRDPLGFGPDRVGSHPASDSPFGVHDLAGNVWEWTTSVEQLGAPVLRGGGFYQRSLDSRSENRQPVIATHRSVFVGARMCATPR